MIAEAGGGSNAGSEDLGPAERGDVACGLRTVPALAESAAPAPGLRGGSGTCYEDLVALTSSQLEGRVRGVLAARDDVRFALLFGSAATRGPSEANDVDVAVSFVGSPSAMDLGRLADALEAAVGVAVDVVDVAAASTLLRWEVVRTGRMVHRADEAAALEFLARVPLEWLDLEPYHVLQVEGLQRTLEGGPWSAPSS